MGAVDHAECVLRQVRWAVDLARASVGYYRRNPSDANVVWAAVVSMMMTQAAKASLKSLKVNTKGKYANRNR